MATEQPKSGGQRGHELPTYSSVRPRGRRLGRLGRGGRLGRLRRGGHLGRLEYTLLALVAVGIAITVAMAIFDPSG
jgi:hypothetical protein